jgi:hypothetical protein
MCYLAWSF